MDPINSSGLPPLPAAAVPQAQPTGFAPGAGYPQQQRAPAPANPVGRPSNDPDQQVARLEKSRATARLESLSPARAKDHKLCVFRTDAGTGRARGKPVLTLLASNIEAATAGAASLDEAIDDLVTGQLPENAPDGLYKCQWYDKNNRAVSEPPPWELQVGEAPDGDEGDDGDEGFDGDDGRGPVPEFSMPNTATFPPPVALPPAPPAIDLAAVGGALRQERVEEGRRNSETMAMMLSMQQQNQAQMAAMMQMQMQQQQAAQALASQAEERDRARRAESRQTLLTMVPLLLPVIQGWIAPKDKGASAEMTVLLELVKGSLTNKGSDAVMFENMMKLNGEMTRQAMALQASGASTSAQMQAEATSLVFKNLMNTLKETMELKTKTPEAAEESTLSTIAKIAGPILAMAQQAQPAAAPTLPAPEMQQQQQAQPAAPRRPSVKAAPPAAATAETAPPAEQQQPQRRQARRAAPPQAQPEQYPDKERIAASLKAIRRMSLGEVSPDRRWEGIRWLAKWLPDSILTALRAKDEAKALALGAEVAMVEPTILQWITDEQNQTFLRDALEDVRLLITGEVTPEKMEASTIKAGQLVQRRLNGVVAQAAAADAAAHQHENPSDTPPTVAPVDATLATDATAAIAPPVPAAVAPAPQPEKRPGKIPPPSAT